MSSKKNKIIELRNENKSYSQISKILNISMSTISYHCVKLGLNKPITNNEKINKNLILELIEYRKTHKINETAKYFNLAESTISKYVKTKTNKKIKTIFYCKNCNCEIKTTGKNFCSQKCKNLFIRKQKIERWLNGENDGHRGKTSTAYWIKDYMIEKYGNKCMICGWSEVNVFTNKIPIELEHIDGDYTNNKENNLKLLCPNCHSLTPTYKGANKKSGRPRKKYYRGN